MQFCFFVYWIYIVFIKHMPYIFCLQGFTLEFHFSPNEYFSDAVLTKSYEMKCEPDEDDPFSFEGPEIIACQG